MCVCNKEMKKREKQQENMIQRMTTFMKEECK